MLSFFADIDDHYENKEFNESFWIWWDEDITKEVRDKFNYYHDDTAKMYYFNQVYRHQLS